MPLSDDIALIIDPGCFENAMLIDDLTLSERENLQQLFEIRRKKANESAVKIVAFVSHLVKEALR